MRTYESKFAGAINFLLIYLKQNESDFSIDFFLRLAFSDNFLRIKVFYDELNLQKIVQSTFYDVSRRHSLFFLKNKSRLR